MRWLAPFHPSTAAVAGVAVHAWWHGYTYLCLAHHASLSFYTLDDEAPTPTGCEAAPVRVRQVRLHARVLAMEAVRRARGPDALLVLTDHPTPRLVRIEPRGTWDVHTVQVWDLHLAGRTAAELGLGLAVELEGADGAPGRWVLAHVYTGQVRLLSLDTKQNWDARYVSMTNIVSMMSSLSQVSSWPVNHRHQPCWLFSQYRLLQHRRDSPCLPSTLSMQRATLCALCRGATLSLLPLCRSRTLTPSELTISLRCLRMLAVVSFCFVSTVYSLFRHPRSLRATSGQSPLPNAHVRRRPPCSIQVSPRVDRSLRPVCFPLPCIPFSMLWRTAASL